MMASTFDLSGKTALVTGSGSGLGFAMARGLAEAGARVVLNGRDLAKLDTAAATLRKSGLTIETASFDVADSASVDAGIRDLVARVDAIDILVNNAGVQHRGPIEEFSDASATTEPRATLIR